jgi:hypothetical protein
MASVTYSPMSGPSTTRTAKLSTITGGSFTTFSPSGNSFFATRRTGRSWRRGHTIPVAWDGTDAGLGPGIDASLAGGFRLRESGGGPTALCALAAKVPARHRGRRLSGTLLRTMSDLARNAGLDHLIAPVRPNLKDRYPTIAIERYARWTQPDGSPFDSWMRLHTLMGARIGPAIPRSLHITGTISQWESWTQMRFPETDDYVFPAGLTTVHIDRERDLGEYWEPNVWLIHSLGDPPPGTT